MARMSESQGVVACVVALLGPEQIERVVLAQISLLTTSTSSIQSILGHTVSKHQLSGRRSWSEFCDDTVERGTDEEVAPYKALLQPLRGKIGKLTVLGRK